MEFTKVCILCILLVPASGLLKFIPICDTRRNLTPEQVKLCKKYSTYHVPTIIDAKFISDFECKKQFEGQRWNCSLPAKAMMTLFRPKFDLATKENAYIYASTAGALMHTVSRGCMEGKLASHCACSEEGQPEVFPKSHVWGGCGDNLRYGYRFSKIFTDAGEQLAGDSLDGFSKVLMNLHNNEAGRWAVHDNTFIKCRCHGVSMNCATKTCHRQLGRFHQVATHLQKLYRSSVHVKLQQDKNGNGKENTEMKLVESNPEYNRYSSKDLLYIQDSPSYCEKDSSIGSFGVSGRTCTKGKNLPTDCSVKCCEKGYYSRRQLVKTKCGCKFIWCCNVKCKTCEKELNIHYCR